MSRLKSSALHIGTYADIPIKVHWTFGFTVMLVGYLGYKNNLSISETFVLGAFVLVLFICVVLHEYGHALTARRYGIKTQDIILSPIGGIARLHRLPDKPLQEIIIAVAGPAVNIVIAAVMAIILFVFLDQPLMPDSVSDDLMRPVDFMRSVIGLNLVLFAFNLIPAFPMDGGRVLRALMSIPWGRARGTKYASWVGKVLAVGFMAFALFNGEITLGLIGVFIYTMATMENKQVQLRYALEGKRASDIMRLDWTRVYTSETMERPIDLYTRGMERSFIVYNAADEVDGCLPEVVVRHAIKQKGHEAAVGSYSSQSIGYAEQSTPLSSIYQAFAQKQYSMIVIREPLSEMEVGIIDPQTLYKYMKA